jgi:hypothetical protein
MTVAEVIYYTGLHPYTLKPVFTAKSPEEKKNQNRYFFWYKREHQEWISSRLKRAGRSDLSHKLVENTSSKALPPWLAKRRGK